MGCKLPTYGIFFFNIYFDGKINKFIDARGAHGPGSSTILPRNMGCLKNLGRKIRDGKGLIELRKGCP